MPPEVADHDPADAVFGGPDGLDVIRPVVARAAALLRPGGALGIEHDETHGAAPCPGLLRPGRPVQRDRAAYATWPGVPGTPPPVPPRVIAAPPERVADWLIVMLYDCRPLADRDRGIAAAIEAVQRGELVVLPTDTVYGIGADAFTPCAVTALLDAKGRGPAHAAAGAGRLPAHPRRPGLHAAARPPATWSRRSGRAR